MISPATSNALPEPLSADKQALLARLADGLGPAELYWAAAWIAAQAARPQEIGAAPAKAAGERLSVVYGSQTGNAKRLAEGLAERAAATGLAVRLLRADAYPLRELVQERQLLLVVSTQGEGEPPDDARGLVEFIASRRAPRLEALSYAVLGLGDSSYPQFCAIGRQLDARLAELGASRLIPAGEADVDLDTVAAPWSEQALERLRETSKALAPARVTPLHAVPARATHGRERPFAAAVLANQRIVARDSEREVRHLELSLAGSGLRYAPGDALGIWPRNPAVLVEQWLELLRLDGAQAVTLDGRSLPLAQWLARERELTRLGRPLVAAVAAASGDHALQRVLEPGQRTELAALLATHQPIDLLRRHPVAWPAEDLLAALRPLTPRLYSIASSQKLVGDEAHLTVAVVDYHAHGARHWGAASSLLAAAVPDDTLPVFVEANERFRLPEDDARDLIMIGPGTGVAPFRAFLQERQETGARGRHWLCFGNRHFARDFLYQTEWQAALKRGVLQRLDLAFSRDGAAKVYVQQRLREQGAELYAWLQGGAHLYVCGDVGMARDVHAALADVAAAHGGLSAEAARAWLDDLLRQGRYARDVY